MNLLSIKWDLYKDALAEDLQQCEENVWFIRPNPNEAAGIFGVDHSSTFPPELAGAAAVMSAKPGEWILDPFGGLGNTAIGAARFQLNTVFIEQNPEYAWAAAAQLLSLPDEFRPEVSVIVPRGHLPNTPETRRMTLGYYAMCSEVDHHFGRLLRMLEEKGVADNTLVVFASDHGETFGAHAPSPPRGLYESVADRHA